MNMISQAEDISGFVRRHAGRDHRQVVILLPSFTSCLLFTLKKICLMFFNLYENKATKEAKHQAS